MSSRFDEVSIFKVLRGQTSHLHPFRATRIIWQAGSQKCSRTEDRRQKTEDRRQKTRALTQILPVYQSLAKVAWSRRLLNSYTRSLPTVLYGKDKYRSAEIAESGLEREKSHPLRSLHSPIYFFAFVESLFTDGANFSTPGYRPNLPASRAGDYRV